MALKKLFHAALVTCALLAPLAVAQAQTYPARPVQLIVPYPAGGPSDVMARTYAEKLAAALGVQVVVDNRAGAGGNLAASVAAKAPPDGYTLFFAATGQLAINPTLYGKLTFDPVKDFAPVALVGSMPLFLSVPADSPFKALPDVVAAAKAKPGALNYASSGIGGTTHLLMEWFKSQAGIDMTHVPYKGTAPGVADMLGGRIQLMFDAWPNVGPQVRAGKLRFLAVSTGRRSTLEPDVPTMTELGLSGFDLHVWYGVLAPTGTPPDIVDKLSRLTAGITANADLRSRFALLGMEPLAGGPDRFAEYLHAEADKWGRIVKLSGAKAE